MGDNNVYEMTEVIVKINITLNLSLLNKGKVVNNRIYTY